MLMKIWNTKGEMLQVQHFDHEAWLKEGWLTAPPEAAPKKVKESTPVAKS